MTAVPVSLAVVRAPIAPMLTEPRVTSGQSSQVLSGHPVHVLERHDDWWLVSGADGYAGWVHRGYLGEVRGEDPDGDPGAAPDARLSLGCLVRAPSGVLRRLPLGAWPGDADDVLEGRTIRRSDVAAEFPREPSAMCATARRYFEGTSYQWGGVTPWGADCSGLVQTVYGLHGIPLPRDAWQQAQQGRDAGTDMLALAPGVLLFFSDRPDHLITHVGISCGMRRMVHLSLGRGGWAAEALDAGDDPYVGKLRERFLFARDVLPDGYETIPRTGGA